MGSALFFRAPGPPPHRPRPRRQRTAGGVIDDRHPVTAPLTQQRCAAALTLVSYVTSYYDAQQKVQHGGVLLSTARAPEGVDILVGSQRVELPLALWTPPASRSADATQALTELPERFHVSKDDIAAAKATSRGELQQFTVDEWTLRGGERVFIVAHLDESAGDLRLSPDPALGKVALFRGSHADAVSDARGSSEGLRVAGAIFALLALGPLLCFVIVWWRSRKVAR